MVSRARQAALIGQRPRAAAARRRLAPIIAWIFAILTAGVFTAFAIQVGLFESLAPKAPAGIGKSNKQQEHVTVSLSTITGFDSQDQPYEITSHRAIQDNEASNIVHLQNVAGKLEKKGGETLFVDADRARYDSNSRKLRLDGNVRIVSEGRYVAKMPWARVTLNDKRLYTDAPVIVHYGATTVGANGLQIEDGGKVIQFFNRVKASYEAAGDKEGSQ